MEEEEGDFEDMEDEEEQKDGINDENKDLYELLEIEKTATDAEIKKAFKTKARILHPDKGGDPEKVLDMKHSYNLKFSQFKEVNEAYEILSDPEKREIYDKSGMVGLREEEMYEGGSIKPKFF